MTEREYLAMNLDYLMKSVYCSSTQKFVRKLEDRLQEKFKGDSDAERQELLVDVKTLDSVLALKPTKTITKMKIKRWYKLFLNKRVEIPDLEGKDLSKDALHWNYDQMEGQYIGIYLDPTASGEVKLMYIVLNKDDVGRLKASIIYNLKDMSFLKDSKTKDMEIEEIFEHIKRRGSRLLGGDVGGYGDALKIEVHHAQTRHRTTLLFDVSNYLRYVEESSDDRKYQGGLGLQIVLDDIRVTSPYVTRIGLIRSDSYVPFDLQDEQLKSHLTITPHGTTWGPLRLNLDSDGLWFEYIMKKYEEDRERKAEH